MTRCHACGHENCPAQADPVGGGYPLHNRMAYTRLLEQRAKAEEEEEEQRDGEATG